MDDDAALQVALRLKALADPVPIKLMSILLTDDAGECLHLRSRHCCRTVRAHRQVITSGSSRRRAWFDRNVAECNVFYSAHADALQALRQVLDPACCR